MTSLPLSISITGLEAGEARPWCGADGIVDARKAISWVASFATDSKAGASGSTDGVDSRSTGEGILSRTSAIQLDATLVGIRPRELDRSGRRELAAILRRGGLALSGLDLFVPPDHFSSPQHSERAIQASSAAAEMVAELAGLMGGLAGTNRTVSLSLSKGVGSEVVSSLGEVAQRHGVRFADHRVDAVGDEHVGLGIDPAALILAGEDPSAVASKSGGGTARAGVSSFGELVSARLSDANEIGRVAVGSGRLDRLAYLVALHTTGYASPVVVDLRGVRNQERAVRAALGTQSPA